MEYFGTERDGDSDKNNPQFKIDVNAIKKLKLNMVVFTNKIENRRYKTSSYVRCDHYNNHRMDISFTEYSNKNDIPFFNHSFKK